MYEFITSCILRQGLVSRLIGPVPMYFLEQFSFQRTTMFVLCIVVSIVRLIKDHFEALKLFLPIPLLIASTVSYLAVAES